MAKHTSFNEPELPLFEGQELIFTGSKGKLPSYIKDHRRRLRERFIAADATAMPDYELLELLLFRSLPRCDVKPVAHRLLKTFGDFNRVLSAPIERLIEIRGIGESAAIDLKIVEAAAHRLSRARVLGQPILSSWDALLDYCRTTLAHREVEEFRVLFLDRKNVLIADDQQAKGTVDHVPVYPREVIKRALSLNASALILVHNHPSGDPTPSQGDIEITKQIGLAADSLNISLHDHLIIGKRSEFSFRANGLI